MRGFLSRNIFSFINKDFPFLKKSKKFNYADHFIEYIGTVSALNIFDIYLSSNTGTITKARINSDIHHILAKEINNLYHSDSPERMLKVLISYIWMFNNDLSKLFKETYKIVKSTFFNIKTKRFFMIYFKGVLISFSFFLEFHHYKEIPLSSLKKDLFYNFNLLILEEIFKGSGNYSFLPRMYAKNYEDVLESNLFLEIASAADRIYFYHAHGLIDKILNEIEKIREDRLEYLMTYLSNFYILKNKETVVEILRIAVRDGGSLLFSILCTFSYNTKERKFEYISVDYEKYDEKINLFNYGTYITKSIFSQIL